MHVALEKNLISCFNTENKNMNFSFQYCYAEVNAAGAPGQTSYNLGCKKVLVSQLEGMISTRSYFFIMLVCVLSMVFGLLIIFIKLSFQSFLHYQGRVTLVQDANMPNKMLYQNWVVKSPVLFLPDMCSTIWRNYSSGREETREC